VVRKHNDEGVGMEGSEKQKTDDRWHNSYYANAVASGANSPMTPLFFTDVLGGTVGEAGMMMSGSSVVAVPASILWGELSDKLKKRKIFVLIGFLGLAISLFLMGLSSEKFHYIAFVLLLGFLGAASAPISTVLVMETSEKKEWPRMVGHLNKTMGLGHVAGLFIGVVWLGFIVSFIETKMSLRLFMLICGAIGLVAVFLAIAFIDEPKKKIEKRHYIHDVAIASRTIIERARYAPRARYHFPKIRDIKHLKRHGVTFDHQLTRFFVAAAIFFIGFNVFLMPLPIFLKQELGASYPYVFLIYMGCSLVGAFMYPKAGDWIVKYGVKKIQLGATTARAVVIPMMGITGYYILNYPTNILPFLDNRQLAILSVCILNLLSGFCWAMISISFISTVSYLAPESAKGEAMGIYTGMNGFGSIAGALIGGMLAQTFGFKTVFFASSAFIIAGILLTASLRINLDNIQTEKQNNEKIEV